MKTIYIDDNYRCHVASDGTMTPVETSFFDGKCNNYIEGYAFLPAGDEGGKAFPWRDHAILCAYQQQYEQMLPELNDMQTALATLGVSVDG